MSSLKDLRRKAGFESQKVFGEAVLKKVAGETPISPGYAQKLTSLWESGRLIPTSGQKKAICEVLKLETFDGIKTEWQRDTLEVVLNFLVKNGLTQEDATLIAENKILEEVFLKTIVESIKPLCEKFRKVFQS